MENQPINRRVKTLSGIRQTTLFDEIECLEEQEETVERSPKVSPVRFVEPDPNELLINGMALKQYLQSVGLQTPLKLRPLLTGFSYDAFEARYRGGGRPPYAPCAMVGIILYGLLQGISSLRDLERLARSDVGCWWLSGGIMPDHSVLGRFIHHHGTLLTTVFFEELVRDVLRITSTGTGVLAGDGTVLEAMSSRFGLLKEEALTAALSEAQAAVEKEPGKRSANNRLEELNRSHEVLKERQAKHAAKGKDAAKTQVQSLEADAVLQPQKNSKDYRGSYKPTVLANENRVIVACEVHPSSETEVLPALLDRAQRLGQVDTVLLDAGFCTDSVLRAVDQSELELLCPEGQSQGKDWNKQSAKRFPKSRFTYLPDEEVYLCPQGQRLVPKKHYPGSRSEKSHTQYSCNACGDCPLKAQCTKSNRGRIVKRYAIDDQKDALRAKMADPAHRQRYRKRQAMVEPVFSHLRGRQGLRRFRRKGLNHVRVEFALHAMAYNLMRAVVYLLMYRFFTDRGEQMKNFLQLSDFGRYWLMKHRFGYLRRDRFMGGWNAMDF